MKKVLAFLLLIIPALCQAQKPSNVKPGFSQGAVPLNPARYAWTNESLWVADTLSAGSWDSTVHTLLGPTFSGRAVPIDIDTVSDWLGLDQYATIPYVDFAVAFDGTRPITGTIATGITPGGSTIAQFLDSLFYPSQDPTAGLTMTYDASTSSSLIVEKMESGDDLSVTLNWQAGRQASTEELSTIVVDGVSQSFTPPTAGNSVSGTLAAEVPRNTNTTFSNVVTTSDGKSATAEATMAFRTKWYYGFNSDGGTSSADILALSGSAFNTTRTKSATTVSNSSSRYLIIAFEETLDPSNISEIWVGGLNSTGAFTRSVVSFTNASGYTSDYIVYVQNSPTSGSITFEIK